VFGQTEKEKNITMSDSVIRLMKSRGKSFRTLYRYDRQKKYLNMFTVHDYAAVLTVSFATDIIYALFL
jgi:hypothetical protein